MFGLKAAVNFVHDQSCAENIATMRDEICSEFRANNAIGNFCHDLCTTNKMTILGCPNYFWHNGTVAASSSVTRTYSNSLFAGKDFVVTVKWKGRKAILKSRNLKESDPFGAENHNTIELKHFIRGLGDVMRATFMFGIEKENAVRFSASDLIPFATESSANISTLNRTALSNLWLLAQDNEFILSKVLGTSNFTSHSLVFPRVLGTCGQFYLVEYAEEILDFTYILPSTSATSLSKPYEQRLSTAMLLVEFLKRFELLNTGLQLCDVKFEHFGVYNDENNSRSLRMIDSDMIYHRETAREAIAAIKECSDDRDCDFVDCEGQCLASEGSSYSFCQMSPVDNNLKRICRNMLLMGKFNVMGYQTQLGLLPGAPQEHDTAVQEIATICQKDSFDVNDVDQIYKIMSHIYAKISENTS